MQETVCRHGRHTSSYRRSAVDNKAACRPLMTEWVKTRSLVRGGGKRGCLGAVSAKNGTCPLLSDGIVCGLWHSITLSFGPNVQERMNRLSALKVRRIETLVRLFEFVRSSVETNDSDWFSVEARSSTMRGIWLLLASLLAIVGGTSPLSAQSPRNGDEGRPSAAPVSSPDRASEADLPATDGANADIPPFHLTRVALTGTVEAERARLQAEVEVVVNHGDGWHDVPLRFNQGHVWQRLYEGSGEEAPALGQTSDEGMMWRFRGVGVHKMTLSMWVPIRRTVSGRQLLLSLPQLPPQFESRLQLTIPGPPVVLRAARDTSILSSSSTAEGTRIEASIGGSRLDLLWQEPTESPEQISQVYTTGTVRRTSARVQFIADQVLQFEQSAPETIRVRLAEGFRLVALSGSRYRDHTVDADEPSVVEVTFDELSTDRTDLHWVLERDLEEGTNRVVVEGFDVEGARRQEGIIRQEDLQNYRARPIYESSQFIQRVDATGVRSGTTTVVSAFEFLKQPFRLVLEIEPIPPSFSVQPVYQLVFGTEYLELVCRFRVHVDSGQVAGLGVRWPGSESMAWSLVPPPADVADRLVIEGDATTGQWTWNSSSERSGDFEITGRFRRPWSLEKGASVTLQLPVSDAVRTLPATVVVQADEYVEPILKSPATPLTEDVVPSQISSSSPRIRTVTAYRLESADQPLQAGHVVHPQTVTSSTLVRVSEAGEDRLSVEQEIEFEVEFGNVSTITLELPSELRALIPQGAAGDALEVTLAGETLPVADTADGLQLVMPRPQRGSFTVALRFSYPIDSQVRRTGSVFNVPVLTPKQAELETVRCVIPPLESLRVTGDSENWSHVRTSPQGELFVSKENASRIPMTIDRELAESSQQFFVTRAFYRTRCLATGLAETRAAFDLVSPPSRVAVTIPEDARVRDIRVDGRPLGSEAWSLRTLDGSGEVVIDLRNTTAERSTLSFLFRSELTSSFGLAGKQTLHLPSFPASVWVAETVWEIELPYGQHLFTSPVAMTPQFEWTRQIITWQRTLKPGYVQARDEWWPGIMGEEEESAIDQCYAFRGFGTVPSVTFRAMNRSLILLIGAGVTLGLGFVFWRFPMTRNIFFLLLLCFLFSVLGLWYLEPILVLLQPAVIGVVLALLATAVTSATNPVPSEGSGSLSESGTGSSIVREGSSVRGSSATIIPSTIYRPVTQGDSAQQAGG